MRINWKAVGQRLAVAAATANSDILQATLRGWLNRRLSIYSDAHLLYAIDHNIDLISNMPDSEKGFILGYIREHKWAQEAIQKHDKLISVNTVVLWWASTDRTKDGRTTGPDKAWADIVMNYPGARNWLEVQLSKAKQQLLGITPP